MHFDASIVYCLAGDPTIGMFRNPRLWPSNSRSLQIARYSCSFRPMAHASDASLPSAGPPKLTVYENTYITTPEGHGQALVWREHKVKLALKAALQERIAGQTFDPITGTQVAKQLAEDLRERITGLGFKRHKLIVQVTLAQRTGQAMRLASKCLWDVSSDGSVSEAYTNDSLYCICEVFGLYYE